MGLLDFLLGTPNHEERKNLANENRYGFSNDEYSDQNHYDYYYDNALDGDPEAIREMRDVFGEDWEG